MLVLSRKLGEQIVVPQCGLAVTVIAIKGKVVRLGISAPENLTVYREESGRNSARKRRRGTQAPQDRRSFRTESAVPCRRPRGSRIYCKRLLFRRISAAGLGEDCRLLVARVSIWESLAPKQNRLLAETTIALCWPLRKRSFQIAACPHCSMNWPGDCTM